MKKLKMVFCITFVLFASWAEAQDSDNCGYTRDVEVRLEEGYGETPQNFSTGVDGSIVSTYANVETGTWTITITTPDGFTCLVASGQSYEPFNGKSCPASALFEKASHQQVAPKSATSAGEAL